DINQSGSLLGQIKSQFNSISSGTGLGYDITTQNGEVLPIEILHFYGDYVYSSTGQPLSADDNGFPETAATDGPMLVLWFHNNLTVEAGATLTPRVRRKGMTIIVDGTLTNEGTISMTARGANAVGQDVQLLKNLNSTFEFVPNVGGAGGASVNNSIGGNAGSNGVAGLPGEGGINRSTGGGGGGSTGGQNIQSVPGGVRNISGIGTAGTSYSGGSGGGGSGGAHSGGAVGGDAVINGGAGGAGGPGPATGPSGDYRSVGASGAGNPAGALPAGTQRGTAGQDGTGGLLNIYTNNIYNTGLITSNGMGGGRGSDLRSSVYWNSGSGGGSGGGSINIFYTSPLSVGTVSANGGAGGDRTNQAANFGGNGGSGSTTLTSTSLTYYLFTINGVVYYFDLGMGFLPIPSSPAVNALTLSDFQTYGDISADINDIAPSDLVQLLQNGTILTATNAGAQDFTAVAVPPSQLITDTSPANLGMIDTINSTTLGGIISGSGKASIVVSANNGMTWYTTNDLGLTWTPVSTLDADTVLAEGIPKDDFDQLTQSLLSVPNFEETDRLRFAYALDIESTSDYAQIQYLELNYQSWFSWIKAENDILGTKAGDYTYTYSSPTTLSVTFHKTGDYKVNIIGALCNPLTLAQIPEGDKTGQTLIWDNDLQTWTLGIGTIQETDSDTTYAAKVGGGLALDSTTNEFSLQTCADDQTLVYSSDANAGAGGWTCADLPTATSSASLPSGSTPSEMLFWDGTDWVLTGSGGVQTLDFVIAESVNISDTLDMTGATGIRDYYGNLGQQGQSLMLGSNSELVWQDTCQGGWKQINPPIGIGATANTLSQTLNLQSAHAVAFDTRIYFFGGNTGGANTKATRYFDTQTNSFVNLCDYPETTALRYISAVTDGTDIYTISGYTGSVIVNAFYRYDVAANTYTRLTDIPIGATGAVAAYYDGKIYVIGGSTDNAIQIYNIASDTWDSTSYTMPNVNLSNTSGTLDGSNLYIVGGHAANGGSYQNTFYKVDLDTLTVTSLANLPTAIALSQVFAVDGKIISVGGRTNTTVIHNNTLVYDISTNQWSTVNVSGAQYKYLVAFATIGNAMYSFGGYSDGSTASSAIQRFSYTRTPLAYLKADDRAMINAATYASQDVKDTLGNTIPAWQSIPSGTEIVSLTEGTRLFLLENLTATGSWIFIDNTCGGDNLPVGFNDGDVLTWDSAANSWYAGSVSGTGSLPTGTNTGDILIWDGIDWNPTPDNNVKQDSAGNVLITGNLTVASLTDAYGQTGQPGDRLSIDQLGNLKWEPDTTCQQTIQPYTLIEAKTIGVTMPVAMRGNNGAAIGQNFYTFSGYNGSAHVATSYRYDLVTGQGVAIASVPSVGAYAAVTTDGVYAYIFGGIESSPKNTAYRYDPVNNIYVQLANLPTILVNIEAFYHNDQIYIVGGVAGANGFADHSRHIIVYDIASDSYATISDLFPTGLGETRSVLIGDTLYVLGGINTSNVFVNTVYSIDLSVGTLVATPLANMPSGRASGAVAYQNGKIYYVVGRNESTLVTNTVFIYDIAANSWQTLIVSGVPSKTLFGYATYGSTLWMFGGRTDSVNQNTINTITFHPDLLLTLTADDRYFVPAQTKASEDVKDYLTAAIIPAGDPISANTEVLITTPDTEVYLLEDITADTGWVRRAEHCDGGSSGVNLPDGINLGDVLTWDGIDWLPSPADASMSGVFYDIGAGLEVDDALVEPGVLQAKLGVGLMFDGFKAITIDIAAVASAVIDSVLDYFTSIFATKEDLDYVQEDLENLEDRLMEKMDNMEDRLMEFVQNIDIGPPTIFSLSLTEASTDGGDFITIFGDNFGLASLNSQANRWLKEITVNGEECTKLKILNNNEAQCYLPANPAGTYDIVANSYFGTDTLVQAITYTDTVAGGANVTVDLMANMIPVVYTGDSGAPEWRVADPSNSGLYCPKGMINSTCDWYDYTQKVWANAVTVKATGTNTRAWYQSAPAGTVVDPADILGYFVYIPRYRYETWTFAWSSTNYPKGINVQFENCAAVGGVCTTAGYDKAELNEVQVVGDWLTHPAFTFDGDELNGLWVAKFETTGTTAVPTVLPDVTPLTNINVAAMFNATTAMTSTDAGGHGFSGSQADVRMSNNDDWGAIAYLSQSVFGVCSNKYCTTDGEPITTMAPEANSTLEKIWNNATGQCASPYNPGRTGYGPDGLLSDACVGQVYNASYLWFTEIGQLASSTNNTSGIYDLAGGVWEQQLDNYNNMAGSGGIAPSSISAKYINIYTNPPLANSGNDIYLGRYNFSPHPSTLTFAMGKVIFETGGSQSLSGAWLGDSSISVDATSPWARRGGHATNAAATGVFAITRSSGQAVMEIGWRLVGSVLGTP
ncbi:IPT/TIG domain-containing protein, partial [Microgenomates group bacterium]|nr:IPT/TIG domain-containing protein [Microgenomates group bacterium]